MSDQDDYEALVDALRAIPDKQVLSPNIPIERYVQEAENLLHWSQDDKARLIAAGLDWSLVLDIGPRTAACRRAQSIWTRARFLQDEAVREWQQASERAYDLRAQLLHHFYYAFRNHEDLFKRVSEIADGYGHADMIQDLSDIAVLGQANLPLLQAIGLDTQQLQQAADQSGELPDLLARAQGDRATDNSSLQMRNRAYTYLKQAVDELRACGQYLFWRDEQRLVGYISHYRRRQNRARRSTPADALQAETSA